MGYWAVVGKYWTKSYQISGSGRQNIGQGKAKYWAAEGQISGKGRPNIR